ncbi:MAG TPA: hypothetical protein ENI08_00550 [Candidatus Dependentiae bacterium]|nr:hypothetical protein [Candidatus Dependentiae bacterium]
MEKEIVKSLKRNDFHFKIKNTQELGFKNDKFTIGFKDLDNFLKIGQKFYFQLQSGKIVLIESITLFGEPK